MRKITARLVFNLYDFIQGYKITKTYKNLKTRNEGVGYFDPNEISTFLSKWNFNANILSNSLMNKSNIKEWTAKISEKKVYQWAYTGGSFGEPLKVPYSKNRSLIRTATFKYFNEVGGYRLGDPFALIRAKNKSSFIKYLRNETIVIPQDISDKRLTEIFEELKREKTEVLMGYPTVMYEMALFIKRNPEIRNGLKIRSLISVSEMLEDDKRAIVKEVFGCNFIDRYSNEEVGMIAQQRKFGEAYIVNKFGLYVEVVDPVTYEPVGEGETGKILVTDLYNDLIPIVRYDTGDLAVVDKYKNGQLFSLKRILGREAEKIFDVKGNPVSSLSLGPSIYKPLSLENSIFQFQFIQNDQNQYELKIKNYDVILKPQVIEEIESNLRRQLGAEAEIKTVFVEDIPPQGSGKRPVYVNKYKKG